MTPDTNRLEELEKEVERLKAELSHKKICFDIIESGMETEIERLQARVEELEEQLPMYHWPQYRLVQKNADLSAENERLKLSKEIVLDDLNSLNELIPRLDAQNADLSAKLEIAVEALEFYADPTNYTHLTGGGYSIVKLDNSDYIEGWNENVGFTTKTGGKHALQALQKIKGTKSDEVKE